MKTAYDYFKSGNLTYPELGKKTGLNPTRICQIVRGKAFVSWRMFQLVSRALLMPDVEAQAEWTARKQKQIQDEINAQLI